MRKESVFNKRKEINNEANYEFISVLYHHVLTIILDANDKKLLSVHNMVTVYPFDRPHFLMSHSDLADSVSIKGSIYAVSNSKAACD